MSTESDHSDARRGNCARYHAVVGGLTERRQWMLFDTDNDAPRRPGGWRDGAIDWSASWRVPNDWLTFEEACEAAATRESYGIGFVFHETDDYVALDLDGCLEDGEPKDWLPALDDFKGETYIERSPSGTGLHVVVEEDGLPEWWENSEFPDRDHEGVEAYQSKFITITGDALEASSDAIGGVNPAPFLWNAYAAINGEKPDLSGAIADSDGEGGSGGDRPSESEDIDLSVHDVITGYPEGERCSHPVHGSSTGSNFHVDGGGETWVCWRGKCPGVGEGNATVGNALHLIGMQEGIIDCGDWVNGSLSDDTWREIFDAGRSEGYDIPEPSGGGASSASNPQGSSGEDGAVDAPSVDWWDIRNQLADDDTTTGAALYKASEQLSNRYHPLRERDGKRSTGYYYDHSAGVYESGARNLMADSISGGLKGLYQTSWENRIINQAFGLTGSTDGIPIREDGYLLVENGVLDLQAVLESDGEELPPKEEVLEEKTHERVFTSRIPVRYEPEAENPEFEEFITRTIPDATERERTLEHLGGGLIHWHVPKEFGVLVGPPDSGKTTLENILRGVLDGDADEDNTLSRTLSKIAGNRFGLAGLERALIVSAAELGDSDSVSTEILKMIHGGQTLVEIERKGKDAGEEQVAAAFIYLSNSLPYLPQADRGFYERAAIAHAPNPVPDDEKDRQLADRIASEEGEGVFATLLRYARQYARNGYGFSTPVDPEHARDVWERWSTSINRFLEAVTVGEHGMGDHAIRTDALYELYTAYCRNTLTVQPEDTDTFGRILGGKEAIARDRTRWPTEEGMVYAYHGFEFDADELAALGYGTTPATDGMRTIGGRQRVKTDFTEWTGGGEDSPDGEQTSLGDDRDDEGGSEESELSPTAVQAVARAVDDAGGKIDQTPLMAKLGRGPHELAPDQAEEAIDRAIEQGRVVRDPGNKIVSA